MLTVSADDEIDKAKDSLENILKMYGEIRVSFDFDSVHARTLHLTLSFVASHFYHNIYLNSFQ